MVSGQREREKEVRMSYVTKTPLNIALAGALVALAGIAGTAPAAADGPAYFPVNPEAGGLPPLSAPSSTFQTASSSATATSQQYIQYETEGGVVRIPLAGAPEAWENPQLAAVPPAPREMSGDFIEYETEGGVQRIPLR
jgi:hypothetical protein